MVNSRTILLSVCVLVFGVFAVQATRHSTRAATTTVQKKAPRAAFKAKYVVGNRIKLSLSQCSGQLDFAGTNMSGDQLDIDGDRVTLSANGSVVRQGEVIAYAQSKYFVDSNVAFTFDRADKPFTHADWKAPLTVSLHLIQNRGNLNQLMLETVPIGAVQPLKTTIKCSKVDAEPM